MNCAVVLFTRDLRLHDHPALAGALGDADLVVPLFVLDDTLTKQSANRTAFLLECLRDLDSRVRDRGGALVIARGDPVAETMRIAGEHGASAVYLSTDVTPHGRRREAQLEAACNTQRLALHRCPGVTAIPADLLRPHGSDHYRVFTPYWRAWQRAPRRAVHSPPRRIRVPKGLARAHVPELRELTDQRPSPDRASGGESAARAHLRTWTASGLHRYDELHDDLAADSTSRISGDLHFGCVSALELVGRLEGREGADAYLRQVCWRDFYHQVLAAFPRLGSDDYRPSGQRWRHSEADLAAWQSGCTGYPIVDAGMRQLLREGWMHNRARMITASFLVKNLGLDWRDGAAHFMRWLVDGDVANNFGNWQWVAGTGNDTRPYRRLNPLRQAERFDADGDYVRRYVPELRPIAGGDVHRPWRLDRSTRRTIGYPEPIVDDPR
jgi:deoxyribodipyrimidine photo-lyase